MPIAWPLVLLYIVLISRFPAAYPRQEDAAENEEDETMANFKYFSGANHLQGVYSEGRKFFGYVSKEDLKFVADKGWTGYVQADRVIEYKSNPSRHECDARCLNATGRIMKCECSCGGKNHGRGSSIICEAA